MAKKLRLAIAGAGLVGKRHAWAISQIEDAELVAIIDTHPDAETYAAQQEVKFFSQLVKAVEEVQIDGIVLSTPTSLHVEQAQCCVDNHIPVLIEKPIAVNVADARNLLVSADERQVPILVGHHRRHNPINRTAHEYIQAGEIGQLRALHANCWFYKPDHYFDTAPWRKQNGAGPISVNLVHDVDLIRFFCGEVTRLQAIAAPSQRGYENEDVAAAILQLANGAIATITVSDSIVSPWSWELTSGEYPIYPKTLESCYLIGGSEGSLSVPDLRLWRHADNTDWWSPISATCSPYAVSNPLLNQMNHFCDVVRRRTEPLVSGWEGLKTLEVIKAIQESVKGGKAVDIMPI